MHDEHEKILHMVEEGTITAEEAQELLEAIDEKDGDSRPFYEDSDLARGVRFEKNWQKPFNISLVSAVIGGSIWYRFRKSRGLFSLISTVVFLPITLISLISAILIYISKDGPWLHIRVRSADGERIAVSLPFPQRVLQGGLRFARTQIDDKEVAENLDAFSELLDTIEDSELSDPVSIDIMDNGDNVQIYFG
ncbi:MAG: hypothetical protein R3293_06080 [Candidatus Promineifilaceae bacterium]|nr:hypothetical protein [Candidatus Promineifilaceae bacterium]